MKSKIFSLFALSIFALVILVSAISAEVPALTGPSQETLTKWDDSVTFTINSNVSASFSVLSSLVLKDSHNNEVTLSISKVDSPNSTSITATLPLTFSDVLGTYSGTLMVTATDSSSSDSSNMNISLTFENTPNEFENLGNNLEIDADLSVEDGFGDDNEWYPFDEINLEVTVENVGEEDIKNIEVEWGLYDKETGDWIIKEKEDEFNLKNDDEEVLNIQFTLDEDLDKFDSDLVFYVWATGEDEEFDDGKTSVLADPETIEMHIDETFVILSDIEVPESASCDSTISISGDAWNIENDEQNEVYVNVYNKELGIDEDVDIGDIDGFDNQAFTFDLELPLNVAEKTYYLTFTVYDEDNDVYQNENDDEAVFVVPLKLEGSCSTQSKVSVVASLESEAVSGKELVVKATILNTGKESADYSLKVADYANWADSVKLSEDSLTLNAGESEDVLITLDVQSGVSGEKAFNLEIISGNELVVTQPISVTIEEKSGSQFSLTGFFAKLGGSGNSYLWAIGALNLLLVLIIIAVAVRVIRKK